MKANRSAVSHLPCSVPECSAPPVAIVVLSFPSGCVPDTASRLCSPHLDELDLQAMAQLIPSGTLALVGA